LKGGAKETHVKSQRRRVCTRRTPPSEWRLRAGEGSIGHKKHGTSSRRKTEASPRYLKKKRSLLGGGVVY